MAEANHTLLTKTCTQCLENHPATPAFFSPMKSGLFGLQAWCKSCAARRKREDRAARPEHYAALEKKRHKRDKEKRQALSREMWAKNDKYKQAAAARRALMREVYNANRRASHAENPEQARERQKLHRLSNPEKYAAYHRKAWSKAGRAQRLRSSVSSGISHSIKGSTKGGKRWESLVGYNTTDLMAHLERQFLKGMTWDNYGEWHIDHVIPVASFAIDSPECQDFKACWSLSNLRPLWARDNIVKSDSITHLI